MNEMSQLLLMTLLNYPKYDGSYIKILLSHQKTRKIASNLLEGNVQSLSSETFEGVERDGNFLYNCGTLILEYGIYYGKIDFLNLSIDLFTKSRKYNISKNIHALTLMHEGLARSDLAVLGINPINNLKNALELYQKARNEAFRKNTKNYAKTLLNEGIARQRLAEVDFNSIENLNKAIILSIKSREEGFIKNTPDYCKAIMNEGGARVILADIGINVLDNLENAIKLFIRAREGKGFKQNSLDYIGALLNEGNARILLADIRLNPIYDLEEAIEINSKVSENEVVKGTPYYSGALMSEGIARLKLAHFTNKKINLEKSIELQERARNGFEKYSTDYALTLMNESGARIFLAELRIDRTSNLEKAELVCLEAKNIFNFTNNRINLIKINRILGSLYYSKNEMREAYNYLKEAIELIEEMRLSVKGSNHRKEYFETVVSTYENMVFTCLALRKNKEAWEYAESAKGRAFLDLLANKNKNIKVDAEIMTQYRNVMSRIDEIKSMNWNKIENDDEIKKLTKSYNNLLKKIKQTDPEYFSVNTVEPITLNELSEILNGKILIEYFIGKKLIIFIIDKDIIVKTFKIKTNKIIIKIAEFRNLIIKLENHLQNNINPDTTEECKNAEQILQYFYKLLIEPIKEYLPNDRQIVIVPHSYLHLIPFQALKGDKYLIEDYKICFAQSATSLKFLKTGSGKGALVVGDTIEDNPLPFAKEEALKIAEYFKTDPILGENAKKDEIKKRIMDKEFLHFACHGLFDPFNPAFSGLVLSDGILTAIDFMTLDMKANLAVLSACETGVGNIEQGDEVEGLVRSIQYGGCRFVIASLWKVEDKSTKEIFEYFYLETGDMVDKIRNAELSLLKKKYSFFRWAPFQIYGI